jgi:copper chaperone CopZ
VMKFISIEGMTCAHCVAKVEGALKSVPGTEGVKVDLKRNRAEVKSFTATEEAIKAAVANAGYTVTEISEGKAGFSLFRN